MHRNGSGRFTLLKMYFATGLTGMLLVVFGMVIPFALAQMPPYDELLNEEYHAATGRIATSTGYAFEIYDLAFQRQGGGILFQPADRVLLFSFQWNPNGSQIAFQIHRGGLETPSEFVQVWNTSDFQRQYLIEANLETTRLA